MLILEQMEEQSIHRAMPTTTVDAATTSERARKQFSPYHIEPTGSGPQIRVTGTSRMSKGAHERSELDWMKGSGSVVPRALSEKVEYQRKVRSLGVKVYRRLHLANLK